MGSGHPRRQVRAHQLQLRFLAMAVMQSAVHQIEQHAYQEACRVLLREARLPPLK